MPSIQKNWACTILTCMALSVVAARAAAPKYDAIYVFGDSYCDVGNIYLATDKIVPPPPYYDGRFSNGPIWVEHVAGAMGLPLLPELAGGTDFAFGGAWATAPVETIFGTVPDVPQQVELYLSKHGHKADPKALYILEGGGNDILGTIASGGPSASHLAMEIATAIADSELALRRAGARNFLIPNMFNVALVPAAVSNKTYASAATTAVNTDLTKLLAGESGLEGIKIERPDVYSQMQAIKTDKTHFGFVNITAPCLTGSDNTVCSDPDHALFWDEEHLTEFGQSILATGAVAILGG